MPRRQGDSGKGKYKGGAGKQRSSGKHSGRKPNKPLVKKDSDTIRLNKYIANAGICSRREADMHISIGSVTVNGKVITEMGYQVRPGDEVRFDGQRISPEKKTYLLLNKPKGFATTTSESKGRTVMGLVATATNARIKPVGRLGRSATGLLLLTNDDVILKKFNQAKTAPAKLYHLELDKKLKQEDFDAIREGVKIEGRVCQVEEISYIQNAPKTEIGLRIRQTGNAYLRSIFDHLGYELVRMDCVMIGQLTKKDLPRGHWRHLNNQEINNLLMM